VAARILPLFPLKVVLFPHMPLPLHIFEPRYQTMIRECMEAESSFGVVAIREGEEVGGDAVPHAVGTLAKILRLEPLPDGRYDLLVAGATRFRVLRTLSDRPYLRGEVRFLADREEHPAPGTRTAVQRAFAEYADLLHELVEQRAEPFQPPDDPELLSYLVGAALNVELSKKQELLAIDGAGERLVAELSILRRETALLRSMLAQKRQGPLRDYSLN
jgi:uncharacterized protein